ncbi:nucleoside hydrolase [Coraliomargarita sp. SDUM461003]|uniref:Nucleoside hydrolase n=1 Tax=Thalassobacterium maritimum TaxID=3041265 RepID=A0ABU1ARG0_9BACT|nr:nucleoside hydrolase [Coraliomargarita sp. SDUM461003]MDQ8206628.1 nucleoside hydrolase [Coraliomargarita sp. SDUM461003]
MITDRIPVIFDTDIGSDMDDTWALAQFLRSPELDPQLILTEAGDSGYRSRIVAKFLQLSGRTEVPVGCGVPVTDAPLPARNQAPWVVGYALADYPGEIVEDGVERMIELIDASPVPVTIIAIGPAINLAAALERAPGIASRCRLVGMFGSFDLGYHEQAPAVAESNVRNAPEALRRVLSAPWRDILITPLDSCGSVILDGANYRRVWSATDDPMLRSIIENYCFFASRVSWMHCDFFALRSSILFDCVAVYLAYAEDLLEIEQIRFDVSDDGFTRRHEQGAFSARVALRWRDLGAFHTHLTARLLGEV